MRVKPFVLAAAVLAATPGTAQDEAWRNGLLPFEPEVLQRAAEIYLGFLADYEVEFGTLAVAYGGDPMLELGHQMPAGARVPLNALSMAITGACLHGLVRDGLVSYDTPLSAVPGLLEGAGAGAGALRLGDVMTHSAGLTFDPVAQHREAWAATPFAESGAMRHAQAARLTLARGPESGMVGRYRFNPANYAVLARVIEQLTGRGYVEVCRERAIAPAGVTATLDAELGGFAAWGGWAMTMSDYLRFVHFHYGPGTDLGDNAAHWPLARIGSSRFGAGLFVSDDAVEGYPPAAMNGRSCFENASPSGAVMCADSSGWAFAASYASCAPDAETCITTCAKLLRAVVPPLWKTLMSMPPESRRALPPGYLDTLPPEMLEGAPREFFDLFRSPAVDLPELKF